MFSLRSKVVIDSNWSSNKCHKATRKRKNIYYSTMDHNDFSISYWRGKHEIWSNDEYIFMCLWMNLCLLNCFSLLHYPQLLTTQGHCPSTAVTAVWLHLKTRPNWHTVFGATVYSPTSKEISDSCTCKKKLFLINRNIISLHVCMNTN